jgi:hypothetical protein
LKSNQTLPNFLIVGAQKCGTTSLHDVLSQHPEVCMSTIKETNFFTLQSKLDQGLDYYKTYFEHCDAAKAIGEASPGYLCYPGVHQLIKKYLGEIKIVIILRDPIKRAYSQYWDNRRQLKEHLSEQEIIHQHLDTDYHPTKKGYFSRGVFFKDVSNYINSFGRHKVKVIIFEELLKNQNKGLRSLYEFLGIDVDQGLQKLPKPSNAAKIYNNPLYKLALKHPEIQKYMPQKFRRLLCFGRKIDFKYALPENENLQELIDFYGPWNRKLEDLLGIKLTYWHK